MRRYSLRDDQWERIQDLEGSKNPPYEHILYNIFNSLRFLIGRERGFLEPSDCNEGPFSHDFCKRAQAGSSEAQDAFDNSKVRPAVYLRRLLGYPEFSIMRLNLVHACSYRNVHLQTPSHRLEYLT